jgi:hypothetical protein
VLVDVLAHAEISLRDALCINALRSMFDSAPGTNAGLVRFFFIGLVFVTVLLLLCRKENGTVIG